MKRISLVTGGAVLALSVLCLPGCSSTRPAAAAAPVTTPVTAPAPTPSLESVQKEILAQDTRRIEAMVGADAKTLGEILRDDLTYIHSSGQIETKAQVIDEIVTGKLTYRAIVPSEQTVRVLGDSALVTGRAQIKATSSRKSLGFWVRFTEVWVRTGGVWQLAAWQSTRLPD
jgi:ketosteroid isomerase-like protein